jgi:GTP 3',8-cyclase
MRWPYWPARNQTHETKMIDLQNRAITYLRISVTKQCNLKCGYCFGAESQKAEDELTNSEIIRLIQSFALLGIDKIRFTGGEPLLRRGLVDIIKETHEIDEIKTIGITTNGVLLEQHWPELIDAGLNRINISLDTLSDKTFKTITGVDCLRRVLYGIDVAQKCGGFPAVKINTVVMRGINDKELPNLARWGLERGLDMRFIEFMPTAKSGDNLFVSESEMRGRIGLELEKCDSDPISPGPAATYRCENYSGRLSFISAVSRSFCAQCNRLRVTSDGEIFGCLFQDQKADLKEYLRCNLDISEIAEHIAKIINRPGFRREPGEISITDYKPSMQAVGG